MGWLRDLMRTSDPPVQSFGQLARLCLEHTDWPKEYRIQPRSLSTLFSKFDREQDLDWLRDRVAIQRLIAQVLRRPLADLAAFLTPPQFHFDGRLLRLHDVRYAREIDLSAEDLPPCFPWQVFHPIEWRPLWWQAPSGSGRSVVGAWLAARGLAHYRYIQHPRELSQVPPRGALYLELSDSCQLHETDLLALRAPTRPLCIASSLAPLTSRSQEQLGENSEKTLPLQIVHSPPLTETLPELIDWLSSRLGEEGHFDPEFAEQWMRSIALPSGQLSTWSEALGLLGLLDELPPHIVQRHTLPELTERYLEQRLRETADTRFPPSLFRQAYPRLVEAAVRSLLTPASSLSQARSPDAWIELLRESENGSPDPEWVQELLRERGLSPREATRLTRQLPLSEFQLLRLLEGARLLRPTTLPTSDTNERPLHLGPTFLVRLLDTQALQSVFQFSPLYFGQALLQSSQPDLLLLALQTHLEQRGLGAVERLLELFDETEPALVAALEATVLVFGLLRLQNKPLPRELCEEVLIESSHCLFLLETQLEPRFVPHRTDASLYQRDLWHLCWHLLAEAVPALPARTSLRRHPSPLFKEQFLHQTAAFLLRAPRVLQPGLLCFWDQLSQQTALPCGLPPVFHSLAQLLHSCTLPLPPEGSNPTELSEAAEQVLSHFSLSSLVRAAQARGAPRSLFLTRLWPHVLHTPDLLRSDPSPECQEFWRCATIAQIEQRARQQLWIPWAQLLPHQYAAWLPLTQQTLTEEILRVCPWETAFQLWQERGSSNWTQSALRTLIQRNPERWLQSLSEWLRALSSEELHALFTALPPEQQLPFLEALPPLPELLLLAPEKLTVLRCFLHSFLPNRSPGWELAHTRLSALELELRPILRARSGAPEPASDAPLSSA